MIMNPAPAIHDRYLGSAYFPRVFPRSTAIADAATSAIAAAKNTNTPEYSLFVANNTVASCVLSPNSANSIVANIVKNTLNSMLSYSLIT